MAQPHRSLPKRVFDGLTALLVAPRAVTFALRCRLVGRERAYLELSERAARWPGIRGERMRAATHRRIGTPIGEFAVLRFGCVLERPPLSIGRMTMLGHYAHVQHASIGENCLVGDHVLVVDGRRQHNFGRLDVPVNAQGGIVRQVRIGDDCIIGGGSTILADIGDHCIVGAGSVVLDPVPDYAIVAGNPARPIGDRRRPRAAAA
jgi:acetyltransferase-like isoleucine patch superfamily enzyme